MAERRGDCLTVNGPGCRRDADRLVDWRAAERSTAVAGPSRAIPSTVRRSDSVFNSGRSFSGNMECACWRRGFGWKTACTRSCRAPSSAN
jgi:hypothetical protein